MDCPPYLESVCGHGRIPYSSPDQMKCVAVGLPTGVQFQQPAKYKSSEVRQIHNNLDRVGFLPIPLPESGLNEVGREDISDPGHSHEDS